MFVEVTREKLVGGTFLPSPLPILNRVKTKLIKIIAQEEICLIQANRQNWKHEITQDKLYEKYFLGKFTFLERAIGNRMFLSLFCSLHFIEILISNF